MKLQAILLLLLAVTVAAHDNIYSSTLIKLSNILKAMDMEDALHSNTVHKLGGHFFKYYSDDLLPLQFQLWKEHVGKTYDNDTEHEARLAVWSDNVRFIHEHSKLNLTYTVALNHMGDMTFEEYKNTVLGTKIHKKVPELLESDNGPDNWPFDLDWRKKGYVTPVKNQGQCGSCWSFSTTGALEGLNFKQTGKLVSLSEQNLVDCSTEYGNQGCNGGLMDDAFAYVKDHGGLDTEAEYPYQGVEGTCHFNATLAVGKIAGFKDVQSGSEQSLKAATAGNGPVSVAIDAGHRSFQFYSGGVYDEPECSSEYLDHGVLLVGYGRNGYVGPKYWLVKNSWSESWGVDGYIMMSRGKKNQCGIATSASYPVA